VQPIITLFRSLLAFTPKQLSQNHVAMSELRTFSRLTRNFKCRPRLTHQRVRAFSACSRYQTDGVYQELTAMRTRMPFIEAFKAQQETKDAFQPMTQDKAPRDLRPKTMSDSYVKVVRHLISPLPQPLAFN
jgi:hypothetical protein